MTKKKIAFILLLSMLVNIFFIPNIRFAFANEVDLETAKKVAEKRLILDVEERVTPNWDGASIGPFTVYYDLNGEKSAYVFTVLKDSKEVGTVTVSSKFSNTPILEYGESSRDPVKNLPLAREEVQKTLDPIQSLGQAKLLYLGALTYIAEFSILEKGIQKDFKFVDLHTGRIFNKADLKSPESSKIFVSKDIAWDKYLGTKNIFESQAFATVYAYYIMEGVPNYRWYRGCVTTAASNIMTYWGVRGHRGLVRSNGGILVYRSTLDDMAVDLNANLNVPTTDPNYGAVFEDDIIPGITTYTSVRGYTVNGKYFWTNFGKQFYLFFT